jgi:trk system potassium uptake protein
MNMIVVGCGRVGSELAYSLFLRGHKVVVIDHISAAFNNLPSDFRGRTVEGDPLSQDVLRRAGFENADGVALVTNSDSLNAVVAHLAREVYGISNVVARNYDPHWRSLYDAFNLQMVSSSSWGAQRIEERLYQAEMRSIFMAGTGEVEIYEFTVPAGWAGKPLKDMLPLDECIPAGLTRAGRALLPTADTILAEGDILLVSATLDGIEELRGRMAQ